MSKRMVNDLAEKLSIPKLKEFLRQHDGLEGLKSGSKKAEYVVATMSTAERIGWENSVIALQSLMSVQAKGFTSKASGGSAKRSGRGKK